MTSTLKPQSIRLDEPMNEQAVVMCFFNLFSRKALGKSKRKKQESYT